jgi:RimJ/RimL family protein N-acetyltransferase
MNPLLLNIPESLNTERLIIRRYQAGDGALLCEMYGQNIRHLFSSIEDIKSGFDLDLTQPDDAEIFVRQLLADWAARKRLVFGVWDDASNTYAGELWIECQDWDLGIHEIGYLLIENQQGKGLATEAANAGLSFMFNTLNAQKAALTCDEDNVSSYRVAERCGFEREGCVRQALKRSDGTRIGKLIYGMLRSEFESK